MKPSSRKHESIDLLKLIKHTSTEKWNKFLRECLIMGDVKTLSKTMYGLQSGMDDLAKMKADTPKIHELFIQLTRSVENTLREIWKKNYKNPVYDPNLAEKFKHMKADKQQLDIEFEKFLKRNRF